jgi:hypothetical protein
MHAPRYINGRLVAKQSRYVLSPTHLHEYKSADKTQAPVMSLYLPEQKLGSHSNEGSSSNKFVLKGRQTGSMHRGHTWVFRAESHDTMMAWFEDIKTLTERTPEERHNLVRANSRSISRSSQRSSVSSDGMGDDEEPPFTATVATVNQQPRQDSLSRRPSGGRFPSDLQVNAQRGLQAPVSPLSASSGYGESFNLHDPFLAGVSPMSEHRYQPQGGQEVDRLRSAERDGYFHQATVDSSAGGPVQALSQVTGPPLQQRQSLQEPGAGGNAAPATQNAFSVGSNGQGPVWAEPAPVHPANSRQHQEIPFAGDGAAGIVYNASSTMTQNGGLTHSTTQAQAYEDAERGMSGVGNGPMDGEALSRPTITIRTDSVPTISNLHIPGEYPRALNAGQ